MAYKITSFKELVEYIESQRSGRICVCFDGSAVVMVNGKDFTRRCDDKCLEEIRQMIAGKGEYLECKNI